MKTVQIKDVSQEFTIKIKPMKFTEKLKLASFISSLIARKDLDLSKSIEKIMLINDHADNDLKNQNAFELITNVITSLLSGSSEDEKVELFNRLTSKCVHVNGVIEVDVTPQWCDMNLESIKAGLTMAIESAKVQFGFL